jgi:carboxymethylenebutenolidase
LFGQTRAHYLLAIAANDDEREPEAKGALRQALEVAKLPHEVEVYPAAHGWCPPDTKAHNAEQAERAWQRLLALLDGALR